MAQNNIGSLVVLKPGQPQHVAGIITERGEKFSPLYMSVCIYIHAPYVRVSTLHRENLKPPVFTNYLYPNPSQVTKVDILLSQQ